MISELKRKSLPAIAKAVGLDNAQPLHHFLANSPWDVNTIRQRRIWLLLQALKGKSFIVCIDETGDKKKGKTTDYVDRQYIGNLGKVENGIVSVNAYGILEGITFPLLFKVYKPRKRLKENEKYKTKPQLAIEIIKELIALGFNFTSVLADSLYGESGDFIEVLNQNKLNFVVAIRRNHSVLMPSGWRVRYNRWKKFDRVFSNGAKQERYIREIIFGKRRTILYHTLLFFSDRRSFRSTETASYFPNSHCYYVFSYESVCPAEAGSLSFFVLQTKQHFIRGGIITPSYD